MIRVTQRDLEIGTGKMLSGRAHPTINGERVLQGGASRP